MSKRDKSESFQFTFQHLIRIVIFFLFLFFLFSLLTPSLPDSSPSTPTDILGTNSNSFAPKIDLSPYIDVLNSKIPPALKDSISQAASSSAIMSLRQQSQGLFQNIHEFPQKQIREIKLSIIKNIYQNVLEDIEGQ